MFKVQIIFSHHNSYCTFLDPFQVPSIPFTQTTVPYNSRMLKNTSDKGQVDTSQVISILERYQVTEKIDLIDDTLEMKLMPEKLM